MSTAADLIETIRNIKKNKNYNFDSINVELYEHQFEDCIMLKSDDVLVTIYITSPIKCKTSCSYTFSDKGDIVTKTITSLDSNQIDARLNAHKYLSDNSKTFEVCNKIKKIIIVDEKHPFINFLKVEFNFHVKGIEKEQFFSRALQKSQSFFSGIGTKYTCVFTLNANKFKPIGIDFEQTIINKNSALYFFLLFLMFMKKRFFKVLNIEDMHVSNELNDGAIIHFDNIVKVDNPANLVKTYLTNKNAQVIHFVDFIYFLCNKLDVDYTEIKLFTIDHKEEINNIIIELFRSKGWHQKILNTLTDLNEINNETKNTKELSTDDFIKSALDTNKETVNNRSNDFFSIDVFDDENEAYGGGRIKRHIRSSKKHTKRIKCNRRRKLSNRTKKRTVKK